MDIIGKAPPVKGEIQEQKNYGYNTIELKLREKDISDIGSVVDVIAEVGIDVYTIHTPHSKPTNIDVFKKTAKLANKLDSEILFHSSKARIFDIESIIDDINPKSDFTIENYCGLSTTFIIDYCTAKGYRITLDVAHLFASENNFIYDVRRLLNTNSISHIHLTDGERAPSINDGIGIGTGNIPISRIVSILENQFSGLVTIEVLPEDQEASLDYLREETEATLNFI